MRALIYFFQSVEISLDCHNFSNMMDTGIAVPSISLMICRSCGHVHLQILKMFLNLIFFYCGLLSFSQSLHLPVKIEGKIVIEYLSHVLANQASHFLPEGVHIFPSLPFIIVIPIEAFFALNVPGQI